MNTSATSTAFTSTSTTTTPPTRMRTASLAGGIYKKLASGRADRGARHRAVLRPGEGDVPAGPLHQGRLPEMRRNGPVRRQLRGVRRNLCAHRPERPVFGGVRRQADTQDFGSPFLQAWARRQNSCATGRSPARLQPEAANKMQEWFAAGLDGLGHLARCALFRL